MKPLLSMFMKGNEVTLTGQNPPLKCCQPFESLAHLTMDLDLFMIDKRFCLTEKVKILHF